MTGNQIRRQDSLENRPISWNIDNSIYFQGVKSGGALQVLDDKRSSG